MPPDTHSAFSVCLAHPATSPIILHRGTLSPATSYFRGIDIIEPLQTVMCQRGHLLGIFSELVGGEFSVIHTNIHCNSHAAVSDIVISYVHDFL